MLTEKAITSSKPKETLYRMSDGSVKGVCLEVSTEGGKRWRLRYRFEDKAKMISLGTYPLITLKEARSKSLVNRKILCK